jgi:hypothetical protein
VVETIPLDGCTVIGDNDIGPFRSEIGILNAEAYQESRLRAHRFEALGGECAGQLQRERDRRNLWNPGGAALEDFAEAGEERIFALRARNQRRLQAGQGGARNHGFCVHTDKCTVRDPLQKVHEGILRLLASISIADMSVDSARPESKNTESKNPEFKPDDELAKPIQRLYDLKTM